MSDQTTTKEQQEETTPEPEVVVHDVNTTLTYNSGKQLIERVLARTGLGRDTFTRNDFADLKNAISPKVTDFRVLNEVANYLERRTDYAIVEIPFITKTKTEEIKEGDVVTKVIKHKETAPSYIQVMNRYFAVVPHGDSPGNIWREGLEEAEVRIDQLETELVDMTRLKEKKSREVQIIGISQRMLRNKLQRQQLYIDELHKKDRVLKEFDQFVATRQATNTWEVRARNTVETTITKVRKVLSRGFHSIRLKVKSVHDAVNNFGAVVNEAAVEFDRRTINYIQNMMLRTKWYVQDEWYWFTAPKVVKEEWLALDRIQENQITYGSVENVRRREKLADALTKYMADSISVEILKDLTVAYKELRNEDIVQQETSVTALALSTTELTRPDGVSEEEEIIVEEKTTQPNNIISFPTPEQRTLDSGPLIVVSSMDDENTDILLSLAKDNPSIHNYMNADVARGGSYVVLVGAPFKYTIASTISVATDLAEFFRSISEEDVMALTGPLPRINADIRLWMTQYLSLLADVNNGYVDIAPGVGWTLTQANIIRNIFHQHGISATYTPMAIGDNVAEIYKLDAYGDRLSDEELDNMIVSTIDFADFNMLLVKEQKGDRDRGKLEYVRSYSATVGANLAVPTTDQMLVIERTKFDPAVVKKQNALLM